MINDLQFKKQRFSGEFTDQNSLANALLIEPAISKTLAYAFGDKYHLSYLTQGSGRVSEKYKLIGNGEYMWPLMGQLTKSVAIVGAASPSSEAGKNFTTFTVPLEDKYLALGDKVKFKSGKIARIQAEPVQQGNKWLYTMQLITHDSTEALSASDLEIGSNIGWAGTAFEDGSKGGSNKKATPMWFRNQNSTSRMKWGMTGGARTDVMVLELAGKSGKKSALWMYEEEYQNMLQWNRITEVDRWYSRYNRTPNGTVHLPGQSGRPVLSGAGVIQQLEGTNHREYTELSEDFLRSFATDLQLQSKEAENSHYFLFTGAVGLEQFDRAMKDASATFRPIDTFFTSKHGKHLKFGANYRSYEGLLGTKLTVVYVPLFDDMSLHTDIDPETNLPYESGRMVFLDMADYEGEPNVSLIAKGADGVDRSFIQWAVEGSTTYQGSEAAKRARANDFDGFEVNYLSETSTKIINPLGCGMLTKKRAA